MFAPSIHAPVLITGVATETLVSNAIESGVSGYVEKEGGTDTHERLLTQIRETVSRKQSLPPDNSP